MADKAFKENRRITFEEISAETGVHRATLSKIANTIGYTTKYRHSGFVMYLL